MTESNDVFICHASADKDAFVRPLAEALTKLGVSVWYDEFSIELGDSISQSIDQGIASSKIGVVVVSQAFLERAWPQHELAGLIGRSVDEDVRLVAVWHGVSKSEVSALSPTLADKLAIDTQKDDALEAAIKLLRIARPDLYRDHPRSELEALANGDALKTLQNEILQLREVLEEYQCQHCGAILVDRQSAPVDGSEKHWDIVESFECGFQTFAGTILRPCPRDPDFPDFEDWDFVVESCDEYERFNLTCRPLPKTEMARKVRLDQVYGSTETEVMEKAKAEYLYRAGKISNREWNERLWA